ncbi:MAG: hypothetical protein IKB28_02410 [Clostridia bacterium]|nr:hypothetical protein [Clostridia bacterium]
MLLEYEFMFANGPLFSQQFPDHITDRTSFLQIAKYNNNHHGIIDNEFLEWALKKDISYEAVLWFVKDFSEQTDQELLWLIDAYFCPYTIYCDESSNAIKFRFKDETGKLNVDWRNDFVLAGIAYEGDALPFDIDELFASFKLQKTVTDAKLGNIAKYNGDDVNRFVDILKSKKVNLFLNTLWNSNTYIHWSTQSLLYFALVDIVDSVMDIPYMLNEIKNVLYKYVRLDLDYFLEFLAIYSYPNIKKEKVKDFCAEFISWIDSIEPISHKDEFCLEFLRQGTKSSKKSGNLLYLTENRDNLLIENFVPIYASRLGEFPSSTIHFDKCGIAEENIDCLANAFCDIKKPTYDFLVSTENRWIQICDFVSGMIAALLAFVNENDIGEINAALEMFDETQKNNLKLLTQLIRKSSTKNKYFDHMSCNYEQGERIRYLISKADKL